MSTNFIWKKNQQCEFLEINLTVFAYSIRVPDRECSDSKIDIDFSKQYNIDVVTQRFFNFLKDEAIAFTVYASIDSSKQIDQSNSNSESRTSPKSASRTAQLREDLLELNTQLAELHQGDKSSISNQKIVVLKTDLPNIPGEVVKDMPLGQLEPVRMSVEVDETKEHIEKDGDSGSIPVIGKPKQKCCNLM